MTQDEQLTYLGKEPAMQAKKSKQLFAIVVKFENGGTRTVKVRAVTREIAERKALKFNPSALGVQYNG